MPPMPYENQLLGAFIYALGRESGADGPALSVNLFQQTPLDQRFGDLVVGAQWCMAIEFKRVRKGLSSEKRKWGEVLVANPQSLDGWKRVADRGHWVCYGQAIPDGVTLLAEPYRSIFSPQRTCAIEATELIQALAHRTIGKDHPRYGAPAAALTRYLDVLSKLRGGGGGGGDASDATWLCAFGGGGDYRLACASSLPELLDRIPPPAQREKQIEWTRPHKEQGQEQER